MNSISFLVTSACVAVSDSQRISLVTVKLRLCSGEVFRDSITIHATKVIDTVGPILADVNLSIGIDDLINNVHHRIKDADAILQRSITRRETSKRNAAG
jgi:hypothetical protein